MNMKIGVKNRLILLNTIPTVGGIIKLKILRELRERLSFKRDEIRTLKLVEKGQQCHWDETKEGDPVDFYFDDIEIEIIREALKTMINNLERIEALSDEYLDLLKGFTDDSGYIHFITELEKLAMEREAAKADKADD